MFFLIVSLYILDIDVPIRTEAASKAIQVRGSYNMDPEQKLKKPSGPHCCSQKRILARHN